MYQRAIAITVMVLASIVVVAQSVPTTRTLSWTPGLTYESGGSFDESQIQHYSLYCDGGYIMDIPNDYTRRYTVGTGLLGAGDHTCGVSETVDGIESVMSNTVDFPLGQRTPTAPTLTVE
jgi:hypothetical protein